MPVHVYRQSLSHISVVMLQSNEILNIHFCQEAAGLRVPKVCIGWVSNLGTGTKCGDAVSIITTALQRLSIICPN